MCQKDYHTTQRFMRHLRHSTRCAALLNGQGALPQAVRPGLGNTHLDKDAALPIPVCPIAEPEPCNWDLIEPVTLRTDYSRELYESLLLSFDAFTQLHDRDEETFLEDCLQKVCATVEPIFILQRTIDKLLSLFTDDENQMLHRVQHGDLGARIWARLRPVIEVPVLVSAIRAQTRPHEIRGAVYRGLHQTRFGPFHWIRFTISLGHARENY